MDVALEVRVSLKAEMTLAEALELESALLGSEGAPAALRRALTIQIGAAQAAMAGRAA